ncbi:MAG TPA: hypothetical protein VFV02_10955 [Acidimicrobiales bacterium]|nr:hypothetical protein [Acidimicrobiales bacterium]
MLLYRPRHSVIFSPARSSRTILAAVVMLELAAGGAAVGGVVNRMNASTSPPGTVQVTPDHVSAGARTALSFTFHAGKEGVSNGRAVIAVPDGWTPPSIQKSDPGQVTSTYGDIEIVGRSIHLSGIQLASSGTLTVTYGGGSGGATEPTETGQYKFSASVTAPHGSWDRPAQQFSLVSVVSPPKACQTLNGPSGVGQGLPLENGVLQPNLYNSYSTTGVLRQCTGPSGVTSYFSLGNLKPITYGPAGYPEVAYGDNLNDQPFCSGCPSTPFPLAVSDLFQGSRDVRMSIGYSLGQSRPADLPRDFIYDVWLEKSPHPGSPPAAGDVEMLIFLYQQNIANCPTTSSASSLTTEITRNGSTTPSSWRICEIRGGTEADPVAFFLQDPSQSDSTRLTLSLRDFVQAAGRYLNRDLSDHSVMGVEVGGEFNQCSMSDGCVDSQAEWQWTLQDLTILDGTRTIPVVFPDHLAAQK